MVLENIWDVFIRFVWPVVLLYAGYLHSVIATMTDKIEKLNERHHDHVANINKEFASKEHVSNLESRLTAVLNRIDDKLTRVLEREAK